MSKFDDLIAELCPNGVEYKNLGEVFYTKNGYTPSKSNSTYWEQGTIPWFRMEDIRENGRILSKSLQNVNIKGIKGELFPANSLIVATSATIGEHALITVPFLANQRFTCLMLKDEWKEKYDIKFLFYYCYKLDEWCLSHLNQGNFASVDMKQFVKFRLPVPPLEIQREIVRVLDNFTFLTAELTAELTARKKQYAYYRDLLLTINSSVPECSMGEVLTFLNGRAYKQQELLDAGKYPVLRVGNFYTNSSWYYSDLELEEDKYCDKGDLLYSWAATLGPKIWNGGKCIYHYHIWKILFDENIIDKMYLYYYLQYDLSEISKSTTHSTMVHVSMGSMKERKIKIPPLNEQRRIAGLISQFDNLCNSILSGLPAEIDVRQKQYEYYRDKLLSFNEMRTEI